MLGEVIVEGAVLSDRRVAEQVNAAYVTAAGEPVRGGDAPAAGDDEEVLVLRRMTRAQLREADRALAGMDEENDLTRALADRMAGAPRLPAPSATRATVEADLAWRDLEARYGSLTAAEVGRRAGSTNKNPSEWATTRARSHRLLAVRRAGRDRFPGFQFDRETGQPLPGLEEILAVFHDAGWRPDGVAVWMAEPRGETDGLAPADLLATDPDRVRQGAMMATDPW